MGMRRHFQREARIMALFLLGLPGGTIRVARVGPSLKALFK